jgi:hypothetical protein
LSRNNRDASAATPVSRPDPISLAQIARVLRETRTSRQPGIDSELAEEAFRRKTLQITGHTITEAAKISHHFDTQVRTAVRQLARQRSSDIEALRSHAQAAIPTDLHPEALANANPQLAAFQRRRLGDSAQEIIRAAGLDLNPEAAIALIDVCDAFVQADAVARGKYSGSPDALVARLTRPAVAMQTFDSAEMGTTGLPTL